MGPDMIERDRLARKAFEGLVELLRTASASGKTPDVTSLDGKGEAARVRTPHKEVKTPPAGQAKGQGSDDARFSAMQRSIHELREVFLGSRGDHQERVEIGQEEASGSSLGR